MKQKLRTKPKGSRPITVGEHLYYWWVTGSDSDPKGHHAIIMDSVTRKRTRVEWSVIAPDSVVNLSDPQEGGPYYPILPGHIAFYIEQHLQK